MDSAVRSAVLFLSRSREGMDLLLNAMKKESENPFPPIVLDLYAQINAGETEIDFNPLITFFGNEIGADAAEIIEVFVSRTKKWDHEVFRSKIWQFGSLTSCSMFNFDVNGKCTVEDAILATLKQRKVRFESSARELLFFNRSAMRNLEFTGKLDLTKYNGGEFQISAALGRLDDGRAIPIVIKSRNRMKAVLQSDEKHVEHAKLQIFAYRMLD